jgi:hypothetical protein
MDRLKEEQDEMLRGVDWSAVAAYVDLSDELPEFSGASPAAAAPASGGGGGAAAAAAAAAALAAEPNGAGPRLRRGLRQEPCVPSEEMPLVLPAIRVVRPSAGGEGEDAAAGGTWDDGASPDVR